MRVTMGWVVGGLGAFARTVARIRFIAISALIAGHLLVASNASAGAIVDAGAPNGTDDTAAIQGLLNQGYIVSLRAGNIYRITRRLDVTVSGSGIIASGNPAMLYLTAAFNNVDPWTMFDPMVRSDSIAIRAEGVNDLRFENFRIQKQHLDGTYVSALWLRGVTNANIVGLEVWGFSLGAIIALDSVNGATIRGCRIRDSWASTAVTTKFPQLTGIVIDDNKLSSGGNSIGSTGVVISNNTISRLRFKKSLFDTPRSVFGMGPGVTGYQTDAITVVGGPVTGNGWNTTIIGNVLEVAGEGVDNFGTRTLIRNNRVRDIYDWGLKFVHGAKDSLAAENDLVGAGYGSFVVAGTSDTGLGNTFGQLLRDNTISKVGSYAAYCGPSVATGFRIYETCPTTPAASAFHLTPNGGTSNSGGVPSFTMMFGNVITGANDDVRMAHLLRAESYARDSLFLGNTFANNTGRTITSPIDPLATGTVIDGSLMGLVHADIDGNGLRDWFVHWRASGQNSLYRQNSNGTFTLSTNRISQSAINSSPDNTVSGDFNGDGRGDVLFHWKGDGTNRMYLGSSIGTFTEVLNPIAPSAINSSPDSVLAGDYNGDGRSDLLFYWKNPGTNRFYYGTASGFTESLNPIAPTAINSSPDHVLVGDYDGNGMSDLLFYWKGAGTNRFFFGTGTGTFAYGDNPIEATAINSSPEKVLVYDANRDARDDLMFWWTAGEVRRLFLGQANRTFSR